MSGLNVFIDQKVLRSVMDANHARDKRRTYYIVGSIFTAMGYSMIVLNSTNYTGMSILIMLGIIFYLFIGCNSIEYSDYEAVAEKKKFDYFEEDQSDEEAEEEVRRFHVSDLTADEKKELLKELFFEISGVEISDKDVENIFTGLTQSEPMEKGEDYEDYVETTYVPLARAHTSYSETELTVETESKEEKTLKQLREIERETAERNAKRRKIEKEEEEPSSSS